MNTTLAERPPWSIAAPHSPAISASSSSPSSMARSPSGTPLAVISPVVRARTVTVRKAAAQPTCAGTGVLTRAQTRAKACGTAGSKASSSATAARPGRHAAPVSSTDHKIAEASSVTAKRGPTPAAPAQHSASSRANTSTAYAHQSAAATAAKAGTGGKSGRQLKSSKDTGAASRPADAPVARKSRGVPALKAEAPIRVQPSRAAKQGCSWR